MKGKVAQETDTELLARLMAEGFSDVKTRFDAVDTRFDAADDSFESVNMRLDFIDTRLDEIGADVTSLQKGQSETNRRLDTIERKQSGMLDSLDETVHQSEFRKLVQRVEELEK